MSKYNAIHDTEKHQWTILEKKKNGDEKTADNVPDVIPMSSLEALQVFQGLVKQETSARRAALTTLANIWLHSLKPELKINLGKYKGKGDKKTGNLSPAFKEDFRTAEDSYFKQWDDPENPEYDTFHSQLPMLNERSEPIQEEERFQYYVMRTRKQPSYANAKNLFLNFVAFVGALPFTTVDDNDEFIEVLMPAEVMRARIANAKENIQGPDTSWAAKMIELCRDLVNPENPEKPTKVDDERLGAVIQDMQTAIGELKRREKVYKALQATNPTPKKGDVVKPAEYTISKAKEQLATDAEEKKVEPVKH